MRTLLTISLFLLIAQQCFSQKLSTEDYVKRYKDIAIHEMKRSGIPASITLAQGILESGSGNSKLAIDANNHFGIKCHKDWTGPKVYHDDDAKGECFRKYKSANESYLDHSNFLVGKKRYSLLFDLKKDDYVSWAHGLKKAGYATNPKYPELLIKLINEHKLYLYDKGNIHYNILASNINGLRVYFVKSAESTLSIAHKNNISLRKLARINNWNKDYQPKEGDIIFLEKKKRQCPHNWHHADGNETLHEIAHKYGIKTKYLVKRNEKPANFVANKGEKISLRKKKRHKQKGPKYYTVKKGDTLYSISRSFQITVDELKRLNRLKSNMIKVGSKLKLH